MTKGSTADTDLQERLKVAGITNVTFEYTPSEQEGMQRVLEAAGDPDGPIACACALGRAGGEHGEAWLTPAFG